MRTLWLLRHAKSVPGDAGLPDAQRPLDERGRADALRLGRHLRARGARPDLVLCSPALRARQTCERLGEGLGGPLAVRLDEALYLASAGEVLSALQAAPAKVRGLMVIGHNPGLGQLAALLSQPGPSELLRELRSRFPTCALCELRVAAERWSELPKGCALADFVHPRTLPAPAEEG